LDELDISIIVYDINPHPEVEDMTVRAAKETNIILIARRKFGRCGSCWVAVDSFFAEGNPDFSFCMLYGPFSLFYQCLFSLCAHDFNASKVMICPIA
jgi:hypothetical protein